MNRRETPTARSGPSHVPSLSPPGHRVAAGTARGRTGACGASGTREAGKRAVKGTCEGPSGHTVSHFVSPVVSLVPSLVTSASLSVPLLALGSLHSPSAPIRERRGTLRPAPYAHRFSAPCPRPSPRGGTGPRPLPSVVWLPLRSLHSLRVRRLPSVATAARRNE